MSQSRTSRPGRSVRPSPFSGTRHGGRLVLLLVAAAALDPTPLVAQCGGGGGGGGNKTIERRAQMKIRAEYDRGRDLTVRQMGPVRETDDGLGLSISYECPGKRPCEPIFVEVTLLVPPTPAESEGDSRLHLISGQDVLMPAFTRHSWQDGPRRGEIVTATLTAPDFLSLAAATQVGFRLGSAGAALNRRQLAALVQIGEQIEAAREK